MDAGGARSHTGRLTNHAHPNLIGDMVSGPSDTECDFCYTGVVQWDAKLLHRSGALGWEFKICDSCRLLLRNVIGPVLHRMSHVDFVAAIMQMMAQRGLTYDDLMQPLRDVKSLESQEVTVNTEGEVVRVDHG